MNTATRDQMPSDPCAGHQCDHCSICDSGRCCVAISPGSNAREGATFEYLGLIEKPPLAASPSWADLVAHDCGQRARRLVRRRSPGDLDLDHGRASERDSRPAPKRALPQPTPKPLTEFIRPSTINTHLEVLDV